VKHYVLDACALLAILRNEAGADEVNAVIDAAHNCKVTLVMNKLNLLEVYYVIRRSLGKERADYIISELKKRPITINQEITDEIFSEAGRMKAEYKISLADSIVLAEASVSGGELLTTDHHEFDAVEEKEKIKFRWIR